MRESRLTVAEGVDKREFLRLDDLLRSASRENADRVALVDATSRECITFAEVSRRSCAIATFLNERGLSSGDRVAILAEKNVDLIITMVGILEARCAYVPLDITAPQVRLESLIANCRPSAVIVDLETLSRVSHHSGEQSEPVPQTRLYLVTLLKPIALRSKTDLAIILYTSGSTGQPKGVKISHQNVLSFLDWTVETFGLTREDVFISLAPLHFDLSLLEIYASWRQGARTVIVSTATIKFPSMLSRYVQDHLVTVWYSTPTLLKLMMSYGKLERFRHDCLRWVLFAGEVLQTSALIELQRVWPKTRFCNLYGPTETNVCTYYPIPEFGPEPNSALPIGRACNHLQVRVVSSSSDTLSGELWVSGPSVTEGYWSQEASAAFVRDEESDQVWYRTGDWVASNPNGDLVFLGRRDRQVKIRGYRIQLGEIEAALEAHQEVQEAAAVVLPDLEDPVIVLFYARREGATLGELEAKRHLLDTLPPAVLPQQLRALPSLPKSSTMKIDYQALLAYALRDRS